VLTLVASVQGEPSFATHGNDACECGGTRVERFEDLAGKQHLKWLHERDELAHLQKVTWGFRTPSKLTLAFQKGFVNQVTARLQRLFKILHPTTVKVIEPHDDVERLLREAQCREVRTLPRDVQTSLRRPDVTRVDPIAVNVDSHYVSTELGSRYGVTPIATGDIQYVSAGPNQPLMPAKPRAGPLILFLS
jgi:hypothetical protein